LREHSLEIVSRELDTLKISRTGYYWNKMFFIELRGSFLIYNEEFVIPRYYSNLDPSIRAKWLPVKLLPALVNYIALPRVKEKVRPLRIPDPGIGGSYRFEITLFQVRILHSEKPGFAVAMVVAKQEDDRLLHFGESAIGRETHNDPLESGQQKTSQFLRITYVQKFLWNNHAKTAVFI
jgi:hypothetical protein